jgi:hypothetical protein
LAFPAQAADEESLPQQTVALPPLRRVHSLHFPAPAGIPNNDNLAHERKDVTTMSTAPPTPEHILQTGLAFWASKTLLSAVEMEVFTELAKGPESLQALTGRLGLHPRASRDFLDALVALGFLERRDGSYSNTPSTDLFLDKHKPSYIGGMLEMANKRLFHHWGKLTTALRTGERQSEQPGEAEVFAALYADPTRLKGFLRAMTGISRGANVAIATQFPWAKYKTATDCGTAQGDLIVQIARKNSHIAGTGFDLPEVAPIFEEYVEANGLMSDLAPLAEAVAVDPLVGHPADYHVFHKFLERCKDLPAITTAVSGRSRTWRSGHGGSREARADQPTLIGDEAEMKALAAKIGVDISLSHRHADTERKAAELGVAMCRSGNAQAMMKGSLHTDELMKVAMKATPGCAPRAASATSS